MFKPDREKLGRALNAAILDGTYATLAAARKQQTDDQAVLKVAEEALPGLEAAAKKQAEALKVAEQQTVQAKEALKAAAPTLKKVRSLDQKIADQRKAVAESDAGCKKDTAKIDADKKARLVELEKRSKAHDTLQLIDDYLKEHAQDEWLVSGLAGIEEQLNGLLAKQNEIAQKETARTAAETALEQAEKALESTKTSRQKQELISTNSSAAPGT